MNQPLCDFGRETKMLNKPQKTRYYAQICEKITKKGLSEVYVIDAWSIWDLVDQIEKLANTRVNGETNFVDSVVDQVL